LPTGYVYRRPGGPGGA